MVKTPTPTENKAAYITRDEVRPEHLDKGRIRAELFRRFGPPPYTSEQFHAVSPVILPTPDPVSPDESKARASFSKRITEAEEADQAARQRFELAENALQNASAQRQEAERKANMMPAFDGRGGITAVPTENVEALRAAREAEREAEETWLLARDALGRVRVKLNRLVARQDTAGKVARNS